MPLLPEVKTVTGTAMESLVLFALKKFPVSIEMTSHLANELMGYIYQYANNEVKKTKEAEDHIRKTRMARADWHDSTDVQLWAEKFIEMHKGMVVGPAGEKLDVNRRYLDPATIMSWFANFWAANERQLQGKIDEMQALLDEKPLAITVAENESNYRNTIARRDARIAELEEECKSHLKVPNRYAGELPSQYAGEKVNPLQNRVMTPPRSADYGKPYGPKTEPSMAEQIHRAKQKSNPSDATTTSVTSYVNGKPVKDNPQA